MKANQTVDSSIIHTQKICLHISHLSGPPFNLVYNGDFDFNLFNNTAETIPPDFDIGQTVFIPPSHPHYPSETTQILTIPIDLASPYSVQIKSCDILNIMECDLLPHDPAATTDNTNTILTLPWI